MKKIIRLTESDLARIVRRVIKEDDGQTQNGFDYKKLKLCAPGEKGTLVRQGGLFALSNGTPFCKIISNEAPETQTSPAQPKQPQPQPQTQPPPATR